MGKDFEASLALDTATRNSIRALSLKTSFRPNRALRRALGFREISPTNPKSYRPRFASSRVEKLYGSILLLKQRLDLNDKEGIIDAWENALLAQDIQKLLDQHGEAIWGDTMDQRSLDLNPNSQLLVHGEDKFYTTDLFYDCEEHRNFIALQLEHLTFIMALRSHRKQLQKLKRGAKEGSEETNIQTREPTNSDSDDDKYSPPAALTFDSSPPPRPKRTRTQALRSEEGAVQEAFEIEMRLYSVDMKRWPPVESLGSLVIGDCTSNECFSKICDQLKSDYSWMEFQIPEDVDSDVTKIQVNRGMRNSEATIRRVFRLFRDSRRFGSTSPRPVEVKLGLDVDSLSY